MDIKVYEDQTGLLLPDKKIKDEKIVTFFNNNIDLYIEKKRDTLKIYCYVLARKEFERYLGYFITYEGEFGNNTFTKFKDGAEKTLKDLGLQRRIGNQDNMLFDNIEHFDSRGYIDISQALQALNHHENLGYRSGNIREIANLCNDILIDVENIRVSVSSSENRLGDINIYINKKYQEALAPNENTKQIFSKYSRIAIENKRNEDMRRAKEKIKEACHIIKGEMDLLENAGYEITDEFIADTQNIINEILRTNTRKTEKLEQVEVQNRKGTKTNKLIYAILAIGIITATLIVLSAEYTDINEYIPFMKKDKNVEMPTVTIATPKVIVTDTPAAALMPTSTVNITPATTPTPTSTNAINGNATPAISPINTSTNAINGNATPAISPTDQNQNQ